MPVADERAETIAPILHELFEKHGPPQVLKSDNGSAFIAEETLEFLKAWRVLALFSPPLLPKYNGAIERSNTTLKVYTHTSAVSDGHPFRWSSDDLAQAVSVANEFTRPWGASGQTPAERWQSRAAISEDDRCQLLALIERQREVAREDLGFSEELSASDRRTVDRMAIARCLQQQGQLTKTPVRCKARKPKRPGNEQREQWFEQQPDTSAAIQASASISCTSNSAPPLPEKTLAQNNAGVTMPACPAVSVPNATAPHDSPPKHRARATFT